MKKIIKKISGVIQVILLAPVKLPGKFINMMKYIGLGLGILESVIVDKDEQEEQEKKPGVRAEQGHLLSDSNVSELRATSMSGVEKGSDHVLSNDLDTGKERVDETE